MIPVNQILNNLLFERYNTKQYLASIDFALQSHCQRTRHGRILTANFNQVLMLTVAQHKYLILSI